MKMHFCICCVFILSISYGINYSSDVDREASYNDCFTWQDDEDWLQLICRVSDFVSPVVFFHNNSNIQVTCQIRNHERGCTPKVKTVTIYKYNNTVTLVLKEKKYGRHLEGKWYCKQGDGIKSTEVSFKKGIVTDSPIFIQGTVDNKSNNLIVECSSCRIPIGPYAEININGKLEGSLRQTDDGCFYKNKRSCADTDICQCTDTDNAFSLRVQLPKNGDSLNVSCFMHFVDSLRGIHYYVTVSHEFEGKDFKETGKELRILKNNDFKGIKFWTTHTTSIGSVAIKRKNASKPILTTSNVKISWWKENSKTVIAGAIPSVMCLVLGFVLFSFCYKSRKEKKTKTEDEIDLFHEMNLTEENVHIYCLSCKKESREKIAKKFCFNWSGTFCFRRNINNVHELHITLPISKFPSWFDPVSFFKCHNGNCYKYFCKDHELLLCTKCKHDHVKCKNQDIDSVSEENVRSYYEKHMSELEAFRKRLETYHNWLSEGHERLERQTQKNSDQYNIDIALLDNDIYNLVTKIEKNQELIEVIKTQTDKFHLFIVLQKLKDDLLVMKTKLSLKINTSTDNL